MSAIMSHAPAAPLPTGGSPRNTERLSKRARALKLSLSARLREARARHGLGQHEVHDRPTHVSRWESEHAPHAPNLLHLVVVGGDERSRPYALEALEWAAEQLRKRDTDPRQLSLLDLITAND